MVLVQPPRLLVHNTNISVEYQCHSAHTFLFRVAVFESPHHQSEIHAFETRWTCSGFATSKLRKRIHVTFPRELAYKPSYGNMDYLNVHSAFIYTWAIKQEDWKEKSCRLSASQLSSVADAEIIHLVFLAPPYQRPEQPVIVCYSWWAELHMQITPYSPTCEEEKGIRDLPFICNVISCSMSLC